MNSCLPRERSSGQCSTERSGHHRHVSQKDLPYEGSNGRRHTIRVSTVELTGDDGQPAGVLLQAQDVTEWLGLEQRVRVAEKLSALHTLSAGVAHELRNPLSAMDLNLHLLEEEFREQGSLTERDRPLPASLERGMPTSLRHSRQLYEVRTSHLRRMLHEVDVHRVIEHIVALMQIRSGGAQDSSRTDDREGFAARAGR